MKISDFKDEEAIDLLADIFEPTAKILADPEIKKALGNKAKKMDIAKIILKGHKPEIMEILARMHGQSVGEYHCNPVTLLVDIVELLSDKELADFFTLQAQKTAPVSFGLASETSEEEN